MTDAETGDDPAPALAGPLGYYCRTCQFNLNGEDQWATRVTGHKHRRRVTMLQQPRFTSDQCFWARDVARSYLQMLYVRHMALLACAAG